MMKMISYGSRHEIRAMRRILNLTGSKIKVTVCGYNPLTKNNYAIIYTGLFPSMKKLKALAKTKGISEHYIRKGNV